MNYLLSIIAGAIQGLTEFLPVSSSGHLVIFHDIFNFHFPSDLTFDVFLHFGTFLALLLVLRKEVWQIIKGLFNWQAGKNKESHHLLLNLIIGIIPAGIIGYLFESFIEEKTRNLYLVAIMFILVAGLFWLAEKYASQKKDLNELKPKNSFLIGVAQILAFIPGTSRSGITIIAGLSAGLKRVEAARFSFLLSLPLIFGASMKQMLAIDFSQQVNWSLVISGFISAFIFGILSARFMLNYLDRHSLKVFAWYRLIIGCLILGWLFFLAIGV